MTRRTLAEEVAADGVALHAGVRCHMVLCPGAPETGIVFRRSDLAGCAPIPALWSNVVETRRGTVIAGPDGKASIGVIEHLMAALAGAEIDDCLIEVDGPEPPILDGDALSYLCLIERAGICEQKGARPSLHVRRTVEARAGGASCKLSPAERAEFSFEISFESAAIGHQSFSCGFSREEFRRQIAPARTFGFLRDAERLRAAGLARGADLTNTLVIDGDTVVNAKLQRFADEFVRHKILDAIGDLALAGLAVIGRFEGHKSNHALNNALLRALFSEPANFEIVD